MRACIMYHMQCMRMFTSVCMYMCTCVYINILCLHVFVGVFMHICMLILYSSGCVDHNINYNVLKHIDITVNHIIYTCLLPLLLFKHLKIHAVKVSTEAEEPLKPSTTFSRSSL